MVCCERFLINCSGKRCFIEDEGGPLGVGLQEQASNRRELHWLRALVVNVVGKGGETPCQVWIKETNEKQRKDYEEHLNSIEAKLNSMKDEPNESTD